MTKKVLINHHEITASIRLSPGRVRSASAERGSRWGANQKCTLFVNTLPMETLATESRADVNREGRREAGLWRERPGVRPSRRGSAAAPDASRFVTLTTPTVLYLTLFFVLFFVLSGVTPLSRPIILGGRDR